MWLLKLHFAFSILCLITFIGFKIVCKDIIVKVNGWEMSEKRPNLFSWLIFFVPILNVLAVLCLFIMISMKKSEFEELIQKKGT